MPRPVLLDPYQPPTAGDAVVDTAIPEVAWVPFFTLSAGPLTFGIALMGFSSEDLPVAIVSVLLGLSLIVAGAVLRWRRRSVGVLGADEGQLLRGSGAGRSFERSTLKLLAHPSWPTVLYAVLLLFFVRASSEVLRTGRPLALHASSGDVAERVTGGGLGFWIGALCAVAIWRRMTCSRVEAPGEKRPLWVRDSALVKLGLRAVAVET